MRLIYAFLIITSLAFASANQLYNYVGLSIVLMILFQSVVFMAMSFLADERRKKESLNEIKSLLVTALLMVILFSLYSSKDTFANIIGLSSYNELFNPPSVNEVMDTFKSYINALIYVGSTLKSANSLTSSMIFGPIPIPYVYPSVRIATQPFPTISTYSQMNDQIFSKLIFSMAVFRLLFDFSHFLSFSSFKYLIPIGLFLRAFPFFRRPGSTLISIGIVGGFLLPPFIYVVCGLVFGLVTFPSVSIPSSIVNLHVTISGLNTIFEVLDIVFSYVSPIITITNLPWDNTAIGTFGTSVATYAAALGTIFGAISSISTLITSIFGLSMYNILTNDLNTFYDSIVIGTYTIILSSSLVVVSSTLFALVAIRSISLALGGEFFLYGVQDYV